MLRRSVFIVLLAVFQFVSPVSSAASAKHSFEIPGCLPVTNVTQYVVAGVLNFQAYLDQYLSTHAIRNIAIPPLNNSGGAYGVNVVSLKPKFYIMSLQEINEQDNVITIVGAFEMKWSVAPLGYIWWFVPGLCNLYYYIVPQAYANIWTPKVEPSNMLNVVDFFDVRSFAPLEVDLTGTATWRIYGKFDLSCNLQISAYPFDYQRCSFDSRIAAETSYVAFKLPYITPTCSAAYTKNSLWEFLGSRQTVMTVNGEKIFRAELIFKRKELFSLLSLVIPTVLLAFSGVSIFIVPADSSEKMGVSFSVLLTFFFIFTSVVSNLPANSESPPVFYIYILVLFALAVLGTVAASIIAHFAENVDKLELDQNVQQIIDDSGLANFVLKVHGHQVKRKSIAPDLAYGKAGAPYMPRPLWSIDTDDEERRKKIEQHLAEDERELKVIKRVRIANNIALVVYFLSVLIATYVYFQYVTSERSRLSPVYLNTDTSNGRAVRFQMYNQTYMGPQEDLIACNNDCHLDLATGEQPEESLC